MAGLSIGQQTFLQLLTQKRVVSENEAIEYLAGIEQKIDGARGLPRDFSAIATHVNKYLKCMDLEIRGYHINQTERVFALINLVSDDVAKAEGGTLGPTEIEIFKQLVAALAGADDYRAAVSDLEALKGKLTATKFEALIEDLVNQNWLAVDARDLITFGPRSYLELADTLRNAQVDVPQQIILQKNN